MTAMIEYLDALDGQIYLFFNGMHSGFFDNFMMLFTGRFIWVPMYAALLFVVMRNCGWRKGIVAVLCTVLVIVLADQVCGHLIRPNVARLRPSHPDNPLSALATLVNGYRGGTYGFPSCHAANSFGLAMFMSLLLRSRRATWFIFLWAAVNSYSRLYLGVHYPGDLLVGTVFGLLFGALCYYIYTLIPVLGGYVDRPLYKKIHTGDIFIITGVATVLVIALCSI